MKTLYVILLCFLFSCHQSPLADNEAQGTKYFPLEIGNEWEFGHFNNDSSIDFVRTYKVVGITSFDLNNWFVVERKSNNHSYVDSVLVRTEDPNYVYGEFVGRENLINFGQAENTGWQAGDGVARITKKYFTKELPAGVFNDCIEVLFDPDLGPVEFDAFNATYAPNIGLIEYTGRGVASRLLKAVVNGVAYPAKF